MARCFLFPKFKDVRTAVSTGISTEALSDKRSSTTVPVPCCKALRHSTDRQEKGGWQKTGGAKTIQQRGDICEYRSDKEEGVRHSSVSAVFPLAPVFVLYCIYCRALIPVLISR